MIPRYVSVELAVKIAQTRFGVEVRDLTAIQGALSRPMSSFGGQDAYPDFWQKAAVLLHGLASTQGFTDGNKRTAWVCTTTFLERNGSYLIPGMPDIDGEIAALAASVSAVDIDRIAEWLEVHSGARTPAYEAPQQPNAGGLVAAGGTSVRLADLTRPDGTIRNSILEDLTIWGPGVLTPIGFTGFINCVWNMPPEHVAAMFYTLEEDRSGTVGTVGLEDVSFRRCRFIGVGVAGTHDYIQAHFEGLIAGPPPPDLVPPAPDGL